MQFLFEFLPLILFLGVLLTKDVYSAVAVLMIAMPVAFILKYLITRKVDKMYFWSTVFLLVAGALTLYFRNDLFLKWKPTVFYWVLATAFLGSQLISDKPLVQRVFGLVDGLNFETLTTTQWNRVNLTWVLFFVFAGFLNIYVAYNYSIETWAKFKVFGLMGITFVFMFVQTFWIANLVGESSEKANRESE